MTPIRPTGMSTVVSQPKMKRNKQAAQPITIQNQEAAKPKRSGKVLLPLVSALALLGLGGCAANTASQKNSPAEQAVVSNSAQPEVKRSNEGVLVETMATVEKDPDTMKFQVYIREENPDYNAVLNSLSDRGASLAKALKELNLGLELNSGVSVQPQYKYTNNERQFAGYQGVYSINVTGGIQSEAQFKQDASKITKAISENGGYFSGPYFSIKNSEAAEKEALQKAVAEAIAKADTVAEKMGFDVNEKKPYSVHIGESSSGRGFAMEAMSMRSMADSGRSSGISADALEFKKLQIQSPRVTIRFDIE